MPAGKSPANNKDIYNSHLQESKIEFYP